MLSPDEQASFDEITHRLAAEERSAVPRSRRRRAAPAVALVAAGTVCLLLSFSLLDTVLFVAGLTAMLAGWLWLGIRLGRRQRGG
ncbi:DUF3040 domain-containing protein [Pseudonocardia sp. GCM10023141]|uniref:DUF3040 domain-containing protein n=1 Tax=Pseudonocardia sp. GCM10023141 TaxID=3252653 RepID=UPI0036120918